MVESVVRSNRMRYHKYFQFGWVGSPELANSIAMSVLSLPHLIVVNSTTQHHHLPEDDPSQLTPQALIMFLDQVHNQSAPVSFYRALSKVREVFNGVNFTDNGRYSEATVGG